MRYRRTVFCLLGKCPIVACAFSAAGSFNARATPTRLYFHGRAASWGITRQLVVGPTIALPRFHSNGTAVWIEITRKFHQFTIRPISPELNTARHTFNQWPTRQASIYFIYPTLHTLINLCMSYVFVTYPPDLLQTQSSCSPFVIYTIYALINKSPRLTMAILIAFNHYSTSCYNLQVLLY